MIFFGWGRGQKTRETSPTQALLLTYSYFHLFWLFRITVPGQYAVATLTEHGWATAPLPAGDVERARADLGIHWWWRWGLLLIPAAILAMILVDALTGPTTR